MKHQTFIICHDKEIIKRHYTNWIEYWDNCTIMFVGESSSHGLGKLDKVVICNKLPNNIENLNTQLLQYTAWYAAINNNLIDSDTTHIAFLEYDITWDKEAKIKRDKLFQTHEVIGTRNMPLSRFFTKPADYFDIIKDCIKQCIFPKDIRYNTRYWLVNTMYFMEINRFKHYFDWCENTVDVQSWFFKEHAANNIERLFTVYAAIHKIKWAVLPNVKNSHCNSHGFYASKQKKKPF